MTLSVIIPVYNGESYIRQAISSVLSQPCQDLELILVNDGSIDNTHQICQSLATEDSRIHYITKENHGVSAARNTGLNEATGTYVAFLDADDWWLENTYTDQMQAHIAESNLDMLAFGMAWTDRKSNIYATYVPENAKIYAGLATNQFAWLSFSCFFYRRQMLLDEKILFPEDLFFHEDAVFCRHALCCAKQLEAIKAPLFVYRDNATSVVNTTKELVAFRQRLFALQKIIENFHKKLGIDPLHPDTFTAGTAHFYLVSLNKSCCILNYREWKRFFVKSTHTPNILSAMKKNIFPYSKALYFAKKYPFFYYSMTKIRNRSIILIRACYSRLKKFRKNKK